MTLAGYAVGAKAGWVYIRGEYPQARERLELAVKQAEELGLLVRTFMEVASRSISMFTPARVPTSAARKRHCWRAWRENAECRAFAPLSDGVRFP
jgi:hypothetical protein